MTFADTSPSAAVNDLNADLARRLGQPIAKPGQSDGSPGGSGRNWLPFLLCGLVCMAIGLGAGWWLFGKSSADTTVDDPTISIDTDQTGTDQTGTGEPESAGDAQTNPDDPITLEDLLPDSPLLDDFNLDDLPLDDLPLGDFLAPADRAAIEDLLNDMPTAEELNELFSDPERFQDFFEAEGLNDLNELLEALGEE